MPFESKSQARFLFAKHPEIAKEFAEHTDSMKKLPEHKKSLKKRIKERKDNGGRK